MSQMSLITAVTKPKTKGQPNTVGVDNRGPKPRNLYRQGEALSEIVGGQVEGAMYPAPSRGTPSGPYNPSIARPGATPNANVPASVGMVDAGVSGTPAGRSPLSAAATGNVAPPEMGPNAQPPMPPRAVGQFVTAPDAGTPPTPEPRPATLPQSPSSPMNFGAVAQALGVLPGGAAIGQMITPAMARSVGGAVMREVNQPLNNFRGDIGGYDAARTEGLSPELARGQVMGNASLRGDMDASGMPGPMARALAANRAITNIQAAEQTRNRSVRDPRSMVGNRTGIAPIHMAIEEQRQADDAAEKEAYLKRNAEFYDKRYAEAMQNPIQSVGVTRDDIKLSERLKAQGRNVSPLAIAQYNAQDRARREAVRQQNSRLPGYNSEGQSPLVQRAMAERQSEREATNRRQEQARDARTAALSYQRNGLFPNTEFALQNAMNQNPAAGLAANAAMTTQQAKDRMAQKEIDARTEIAQSQLQQATLESGSRLAQQREIEQDRNRQMEADRQLKQNALRTEQGMSLVEAGQQLMITDPVRGRQMVNQGLQQLSPLATGQMPVAPGQVPPLLQAPSVAAAPQSLSEAQDVSKSASMNRNLQAFLPQVANLKPAGITQGIVGRLNSGVIPDEDALVALADYMTSKAMTDAEFNKQLNRSNFEWKQYLDAIMKAPPGQKRDALMKFHQSIQPKQLAPTNPSGYGDYSSMF